MFVDDCHQQSANDAQQKQDRHDRRESRNRREVEEIEDRANNQKGQYDGIANHESVPNGSWNVHSCACVVLHSTRHVDSMSFNRPI